MRRSSVCCAVWNGIGSAASQTTTRARRASGSIRLSRPIPNTPPPPATEKRARAVKARTNKQVMTDSVVIDAEQIDVGRKRRCRESACARPRFCDVGRRNPRGRCMSLHVAVVGAGLGGLSSALFLRARGIDVSVYEQGGAFQDVGAGIVIAPNMVRPLQRLGIAFGLEDFAVRLDYA